MKPWSISTTVRNPERIRNFLSVLKKIEGEVWNSETQEKFQILLIQYKFYGFGEAQFYNGLSKEQIELMDNPNVISFDQASQILYRKNYVGGGDMRGRQSYNPIEKMGLAYLNEKKEICISDFGNYYLEDNYDIGKVFFISFIKWQLPNPDSNDYKAGDGFNIKPFVATLHLINEVNKICENNGDRAKGISKLEFSLFGLSLYNYLLIKEQAQNIYNFRIIYDKIKSVPEKNNFVDSIKQTNLCHIDGVENLETYADNVIRYFRLTRYIYIRGGGWYIDLEPRRKIEIKALLANDNGSALSFKTQIDYRNYICDIKQPILPWESKVELVNIGKYLINDIKKYEQYLLSKGLKIPSKSIIELNNLSLVNLKNYIEELRDYRKILQQEEIHFASQAINEIEIYKNKLENIFHSREKKSVELEHLISLALNALNDALKIKPNYPVGDDNEPIFTAPSNKPDIECYYDKFNSICEVTMLTNRQQWYAEGQPVMRHLRDFESNSSKDTYCLFIAPKLHRDTINTYWLSVKYEYEGKKQKIIPLTIIQFLSLLETLIERKKVGKKIYNYEIKLLFDDIIKLSENISNSDKWISLIPETIKKWKIFINKN